MSNNNGNHPHFVIQYLLAYAPEVLLMSLFSPARLPYRSYVHQQCNNHAMVMYSMIESTSMTLPRCVGCTMRENHEAFKIRFATKKTDHAVNSWMKHLSVIAHGQVISSSLRSLKYYLLTCKSTTTFEICNWINKNVCDVEWFNLHKIDWQRRCHWKLSGS